MKIIKGSSTASLRFGGASVRAEITGVSYSENVQWLGDSEFVKTQTGSIDFDNPGTVGGLHLLQRVYEPGTSTEFCVSADTPNSDAVSHVNIYYGGAEPFTQATIEQRNGIQGYWFDLDHDDPGEGVIEERTIYAEIVPDGGSLISKVISQTIKVGQRNIVSLTPADCIGSNHLHSRMAWNQTPDGTVLELASGLYYFRDIGLPQSNPYNNPWLEVRAANGADVEIRTIRSYSEPDSSYEFSRIGRPVFRTKHVTFDNITWNVFESSEMLHEGHTAWNNCKFIDSVTTYHNFPAATIGSGRPFRAASGSSVNWYTQQLFTKPEGPYTNTVQIHNSEICTLTSSNANEYFNCRMANSFDVFYNSEAIDGLVVKSCIQQAPYSNNSVDLETLRYLNNSFGTRGGTYDNGVYTYSYDDARSIQESTYQITAIDKTNPNEYAVELDADITIWPPRFTPGTGYQVLNGNPVYFYDFLMFKWSAGDDLTVANRKFVQKPDGNGALYASWVTEDTANGVLSNVVRFFRGVNKNAAVDQSGLFNFDTDFDLNVGDRITLMSWAHADFFQTANENGLNLHSVLFQDVASVFEQQMLWQSNGTVRDFVFSNCMFIEPTGLKSDFNLSIEKPIEFSQAWKWCTMASNNFDFSTSAGLDIDKFRVYIGASLCAGVNGDGGSGTWDLSLVDSVYSGSSNFGSGISSTSGSTQSQIVIGTGLNTYGVPQSGTNAEKTSTLSRLPYGVDGGARSAGATQIGAVSDVDLEYQARSGDYFVGYPDASHWSPASSTTVTATPGFIETTKASPAVSYQWYTQDGAISGATSSTYLPTGKTGDRLWCLVTHGDVSHWVDFGIVQ